MTPEPILAWLRTQSDDRLAMNWRQLAPTPVEGLLSRQDVEAEISRRKSGGRDEN